MSKKQAAIAAASRFFELAIVAANHGGFWVSAGGGTARVAARAIADQFKIDFAEAMSILDQAGCRFFGNEEWYSDLAWSQPWSPFDFPEDLGRWDVWTIAKAACRRPYG